MIGGDERSPYPVLVESVYQLAPTRIPSLVSLDLPPSPLPIPCQLVHATFAESVYSSAGGREVEGGVEGSEGREREIN